MVAFPNDVTWSSVVNDVLNSVSYNSDKVFQCPIMSTSHRRRILIQLIKRLDYTLSINSHKIQKWRHFWAFSQCNTNVHSVESRRRHHWWYVQGLYVNFLLNTAIDHVNQCDWFLHHVIPDEIFKTFISIDGVIYHLSPIQNSNTFRCLTLTISK